MVAHRAIAEKVQDEPRTSYVRKKLVLKKLVGARQKNVEDNLPLIKSERM